MARKLVWDNVLLYPCLPYFSFGVFTTQMCEPSQGEIDFYVQGEAGPFQYSFDGINYQDNGHLFFQGFGLHTIWVKNKFGNLFYYTVGVAKECFFKIDYIAVDASCKQNDGKLTITTKDGVAPYIHTIDGINYQTSNVFTNLAPGNYVVTVKDNTGFASSMETTVYDRCPLATAVATNAACAGNDGSITATATNGTEPYQFSVDGNNFQTNNIFNNLSAGNCIVQLTTINFK